MSRIVDEFYSGVAEKDWPMWGAEAVAEIERLMKVLRQIAHEDKGGYLAAIATRALAQIPKELT